MQPDGRPTPDTALAWFAAAVAPLPGVAAAAEPPDPSLAIAAVYSRWEDLSDGHRDAVTAALEVLAAGEVPRGFRRVAASDLDVLADDVESAIAAALGRALRIDWSATRAAPGLPAPAVTVPVFDPATGKLQKCTTVLGDAAPAGGVELRSLVTSEAFMCFEFDLLMQQGLARVPLWVLAGQRAWVGETLTDGAAGTARSTKWWDTWLLEPERPLTLRRDDAIGWFAALHAAQGSAWPLLDPVLTAGSGATAVVGSETIEQWATRLVRRPDLGATWETTGPGVTTARSDPGSVTVSSSAPTKIGEIPGQAAWSAKLTATGDVLVVDAIGTVAGGLALGSKLHPVTRGTTRIAACLIGDCRCPDGTAPVPGLLTGEEGSILLALAAPDGPAKVDAHVVNLSDACPPPPTAPEVDTRATIEGEWVSTRWVMPADVFGTVTGGSGVRLLLAGGDVALDFVEMDPLRATMATSGVEVENVTKYMGALSGTYTADPATGAFEARYTSNDLRVRVETIVDGTSAGAFDTSADEAASRYGLPTPMTSATYDMSGDTLILSQQLAGGQEIQIVFVRA